jgi:hypothetical protein
MSDGGKGSAPRPFSVSDEVFASNFDRIFGKKQQTHEKDGVYSAIPTEGLVETEKGENDAVCKRMDRQR